MRYYFIYSAGGGAGDWNGLKRIWNRHMPIELKGRILLKFGDVFFNHASASNLIKPSLWSSITNLRNWLFNATQDPYVLSDSDILLDSGTSKIVNFISNHNPTITSQLLVEQFNYLVTTNNILEKYADIINTSNINKAVTFDIPNTFKIRTQNGNTRTNIFTGRDNQLLLRQSADYANQLYSLLGSDRNIITTINGQWNSEELDMFFNLLKYQPSSLAIGGLTRASDTDFNNCLHQLNQNINLSNFQKVHFLGCGGIKNARAIKQLNFNIEDCSVDNSTPWNRAIDGNTAGSKQSGYFDYQSKKLVRITPYNRDRIILLHTNANNPLLELDVATNMIDGILQHQNNNSSELTYNARALLAIHNNDVFRINAL